MSNYSLSLQDVMESVDEYLTESILSAAGKGIQKGAHAVGKGVQKPVNKLVKGWANKIQDNEDKKKAKKLANDYYDTDEGRKELVGSAYDSFNNHAGETIYDGDAYGKLKKKHPHSYKERFEKKAVGDLRNMVKDDVKKTRKAKEREIYNDIKANKYALDTQSYKDDLDDLRLRIYEAYEEGYISEEDKYYMLESLNLDNYEKEDSNFLDYLYS